MDAESLILQQIQLEFALDTQGDLVPRPGSTERARFVVHRHGGGFARFYRHDLPPDLRSRLAALPGTLVFVDRDAVAAILAEDAPCSATFFGTSGVFAFPLGPRAHPAVTRRGCEFVVMKGDVKAAVAWSVREDGYSAEVAVETAEGFRRRGYGRQVAAAWADSVLAQGKTAFYSYAEQNLASRALARSLSVVEFSTVAAYD
jgi:hypothetical protein